MYEPVINARDLTVDEDQASHTSQSLNSYFNNDSMPVTKTVGYVGRARIHRYLLTLLWSHDSHRWFLFDLPYIPLCNGWLRMSPYSWVELLVPRWWCCGGSLGGSAFLGEAPHWGRALRVQSLTHLQFVFSALGLRLRLWALSFLLNRISLSLVIIKRNLSWFHCSERGVHAPGIGEGPVLLIGS